MQPNEFEDDGQETSVDQPQAAAASTAGPGQIGHDTHTNPASVPADQFEDGHTGDATPPVDAASTAGTGQRSSETRSLDAPAPADQFEDDGQMTRVDQSGHAAASTAGPGQFAPDTQDYRASVPADLSTTIAEIIAEHRKRCFAMETRKRLDLSLLSLLRTVLGWSLALPAEERDAIRARAQAIAAGEPDPVAFQWMAIVEAHNAGRAPFDAVEKAAEKDMDRLARSLPAWPWFAANVFKSSAVSLAVIVGEAGDLARYATPAKLWKRMGVGLVDGVRQGGLAATAPKADWIKHGYNRQRRSRLWNIGDSLVKKQGYLRDIYLARKEYERVKAESKGLTVAPTAKIPAKRAAEFMSDGHVHRRAQRYMEKRLLKDLWVAWRKAMRMSEPIADMPSADSFPPGDEPARAAIIRVQPARPLPPASPSAGHARIETHDVLAGGEGGQRRAETHTSSAALDFSHSAGQWHDETHDRSAGGEAERPAKKRAKPIVEMPDASSSAGPGQRETQAISAGGEGGHTTFETLRNRAALDPSDSADEAERPARADVKPMRVLLGATFNIMVRAHD